MDNDYLDSQEAAQFLGVVPATLYSYVSRGLITSQVRDPASRKRYYLKADLLALRHRSAYRRDPEGAAKEVIEFGNPILTTAISLITEDGHYYRGRSSSELAQTHSFEEVAQFLWTGELKAASDHWDEKVDEQLFANLPAELTTPEKMQCILPLLQYRDLRSYGKGPATLLPRATSLLLPLLWLSSGRQRQGSAARTLQLAWKPAETELAATLDTIMIILADHELNIATFTARCAASAGASLHQTVLAGLAALQGHKHLHGQVFQARRLFQEVLADGNVESVIRRHLQRGETLPGFHNPYRRLYPHQDPRVVTLTENLQRTPGFPLLQETISLCRELSGEHPRIDFLLACSEVLLELPRDAIFSLIAISRTAGMIGHVLEQFSSDRIIRPRARYEGN
jgi:citrate synthase